jgi:hypothetical protein
MIFLKMFGKLLLALARYKCGARCVFNIQTARLHYRWWEWSGHYSFLTLLISKTCSIEESGSFLAIQGGTCFGFGVGAATRTILVLLRFKNKAFLCQFFRAFPVLLKSFIAV